MHFYIYLKSSIYDVIDHPYIPIVVSDHISFYISRDFFQIIILGNFEKNVMRKRSFFVLLVLQRTRGFFHVYQGKVRRIDLKNLESYKISQVMKPHIKELVK